MNSKKQSLKTRRRILLAVWILSLIVISNYGGPISYGFFFAVTLLPILSFVYLLFVFSFFKIYQKLDSRDVVCGKPTPYLFILRNEGFYPFTSVSVKLFSFYSFVENMDEDTEYELLRGDEYTFETKLTCKYRGEYEVGIKEIEIIDFLRLFRLKYKVPSTIRALVKPKITKISCLNSVEAINGLLQREYAQIDTEPDVVVRDYVSGDSIKHISWKVSAREQSLKVRKIVGEEKQGILVVGDTKRYFKDMQEYLPLESKLLEVMSSLGIYLAENGMTYSAYYREGQIKSCRVENLSGYQEYYDMLSKVRFNSSESFAVTMQELMDKGILWRNKIIFAVLHQMDDDIMNMVEKLSNAGVIVVLYIVSDEACDRYIGQCNERRIMVQIPIEGELEGRL
ncbi:MAG: DUF58 domain-containing protein [Lachnospiraceae bacterium]|nr:DUF58 domain-containing protein [Lachnospiraceae bacterium]